MSHFDFPEHGVVVQVQAVTVGISLLHSTVEGQLAHQFTGHGRTQAVHETGGKQRVGILIERAARHAVPIAVVTVVQ